MTQLSPRQRHAPWSPGPRNGVWRWGFAAGPLADLDAVLTTTIFEHFVRKKRPPRHDAANHLLLPAMRIGVIEIGTAVTSPSLRLRHRRPRALDRRRHPSSIDARLIS